MMVAFVLIVNVEHWILAHRFPYHLLLFPLSGSFHSAGFASHSCQKRHGKPAKKQGGKLSTHFEQPVFLQSYETPYRQAPKSLGPFSLHRALSYLQWSALPSSALICKIFPLHSFGSKLQLSCIWRTSLCWQKTTYPLQENIWYGTCLEKSMLWLETIILLRMLLWILNQ